MKTIVLIDSGNTRLKVGMIDGAAIGVGGAVGAASAADAASAEGAGGIAGFSGFAVGRDGLGRDIQGHALDNDDIQGLKDWLAALPSAPVAALGTNVAGAGLAAAIEAALDDIGCPLRWIVPQARAYGLTSRYTRPEQLGPDRWVSMLGVLALRDAAAHASGGHSGTGDHTDAAGIIGLGGVHGAADTPVPFLLASFGTATTLDTVSGDGVFEGGLILPGPMMMRRSLVSGTANLPLVQGDATAFPTDTQQAISSGVAAAQAGAVLRQWLAGLQRYGTEPQIYAAGGGWREVEVETRRLLTEAASAMGRLPPAVTVIENPVLHGLTRIAAATNLGSS